MNIILIIQGRGEENIRVGSKFVKIWRVKFFFVFFGENGFKGLCFNSAVVKFE